jgi:hypothetical protein
MPLTRSQISLIHVAKERVGMTDDAYRDMLKRVAGVTSSTALNRKGFEIVMDEFNRFGFKNPKRFGERKGMASPRQLSYIRGLWDEYTGIKNDDAVVKFIANKWHVSHLRFVTAELAPKIITTLQHMVKQPQSASKKAQKPEKEASHA